MKRSVLGLTAVVVTGLAAALPSGGSASAAGPASGSGSAASPDLVARALARTGPTAREAVRALRLHPGAARLSDGTRFRVTDALADPDGSTHVRLDRTYRGLPVLGGDVVVHRGPRGGWRAPSQTLRRPVDLAVAPQVSRQRAADLTRSLVGGRVRSTRLVVDAIAGRPRLAVEVVTTGRQADGTPSRLASYVDARSGRVLRSEQQIETVNGSGQSLYSGVVPLQVTQSGSTYSLKDPTRGGTYTNDVNNQTDGALCSLLSFGCRTGTTFTSPTSTFGAAAGSRARAGVDAQYGTNVTWDYYKNTFGRNGIFGTGAGSWNRVHYGSGYVNAFWDGTKMTYGDGDGVSYGPLVSLDVAGHEMSHGVTENTAKLTYSGESGGLNEATSDIFGTMVEFSANNANDPGDYLIGEQFDLKKHLGLRRMDDQAKDGSSVDCYSSTAGNLDVHYSSGIANHFFYLLAEGSTPKTLNGVAYNAPICPGGGAVTGIGNTKAAGIWYRALTTYMTSGTNYAAARTATLNAARDLYGATSPEYTAVNAAWSASGVR